jgi:hypothetical protein
MANSSMAEEPWDRTSTLQALAVILPLIAIVVVFYELHVQPYPTTTLFSVAVATLAVLLAAMSFIYGQFRTLIADVHVKAAVLDPTTPSDSPERLLLLAELSFATSGTRLMLSLLALLFATVSLAGAALVYTQYNFALIASASYDLFAVYVGVFLLLFVISLWKRIAFAEKLIRTILRPKG